MRKTRVEETIELTGDLVARIVAERKGQELLHVGDGVVVKLTVVLPSNAKQTHMMGYLSPELEFKRRVEIMGEFLDWGWGYCHRPDTTFRRADREFSARTWKAAFAEALDYGRAEVQKLVDALRAREQALIDAEE